MFDSSLSRRGLRWVAAVLLTVGILLALQLAFTYSSSTTAAGHRADQRRRLGHRHPGRPGGLPAGGIGKSGLASATPTAHRGKRRIKRAEVALRVNGANWVAPAKSRKEGARILVRFRAVAGPMISSAVGEISRLSDSSWSYRVGSQHSIRWA